MQEFRGGAFFQQEAFYAKRKCFPQVLLILVHRKDDESAFKSTFVGAADHLQAIHQGHADIQDSDVEMLLVSGTVDVSTPPRTLDEARPHFHKAQIVLLPEFSHVGDVESFQPAALERLINSYYDTGVADSSLYVYEPVSFKPGFSLTLAARVLVGGMVVVPALVLLGVFAAVRRVRRHRTIQT